jgi:magnesium-transporting ATPase (P-type)
LFELIKEALEDPTLVMLCISAAVSLVLGIAENPATGWIEGTAILSAVVIVVMVASLNDYQKEKQFRKLNEKKDSRVSPCALCIALLVSTASRLAGSNCLFVPPHCAG